MGKGGVNFIHSRSLREGGGGGRGGERVICRVTRGKERRENKEWGAGGGGYRSKTRVVWRREVRTFQWMGPHLLSTPFTFHSCPLPGDNDNDEGNKTYIHARNDATQQSSVYRMVSSHDGHNAQSAPIYQVHSMRKTHSARVHVDIKTGRRVTSHVSQPRRRLQCVVSVC